MSKQFKGTPGIWRFHHNSASDIGTACLEVTSTESMHGVAYLQSTEPKIFGSEMTSFDRTIANANLIAAAPEMLKLLQKFAWAIKEGTQMDIMIAVDESDLVIAKALGETK